MAIPLRVLIRDFGPRRGCVKDDARIYGREIIDEFVHVRARIKRFYANRQGRPRMTRIDKQNLLSRD